MKGTNVIQDVMTMATEYELEILRLKELIHIKDQKIKELKDDIKMLWEANG